MKLKREDRFPITQDQIRDIFSALGIGYKDLREICGLSEFAPNRWRKSGQIPTRHLLALAQVFTKKFQGIKREDLTPVQQRASSLLEGTWLKAYIIAKDSEGSAVKSSASVIQNVTSTASTNPLSRFTEIELMRELESRGLRVVVSVGDAQR